MGYTSNLKTIISSLNTVKDALTKKKENLFTISQPLAMEVPSGIAEDVKAVNRLITENNAYTDSLAQKMRGAKDRLRFGEIKLLLDEWRYSNEENILSQLEGRKKTAQLEYDNIKKKLDAEEASLRALYEETTDESAVAEMINKALIANGRSSFSLRLAKDDEFGQSGQYNVIGRDGLERKITELSTGEKNAVAVLYFLYSLEIEFGKESSSFLIIIDDPVNSNDDTMQYMIISEITKLYNKDILQGNNNKIIILTHNTHFFLNVRPYGNARYNKRYGSYCLVTGLDEKTNIITIEKKENDLKNNYDCLWINLVASYLNNNPDNMLNNARRICGSFADFNRIDVNDFYGESGIKKTLDVNSHEISGEEMKTTGITATGLKNALRQLFVDNGYEEHFDEHWAFGEVVTQSKQAGL